MVVAGFQENESSSKVLNFHVRLGVHLQETFAAVKP